MIDARELRIGNLVYSSLVNIQNNKREILLVQSVHEKGVNCQARCISKYEAEMECIPFDGLSGIPLTSEWLLKFGFEKQLERISNIIALPGSNDGQFHGAIEFLNNNYTAVFLYNNKFSYIIDENTDDYGSHYTYKEIQFVHQLQNTFYILTGNELTQQS